MPRRTEERMASNIIAGKTTCSPMGWCPNATSTLSARLELRTHNNRESVLAFVTIRQRERWVMASLRRLQVISSHVVASNDSALLSAENTAGSAQPVKEDANFRVESDTFGPLRVPRNRYWGAQTQRCGP